MALKSIGTIESEDSLAIHFKTMSEIVMVIPKDQVKGIEYLSGVSIASENLAADLGLIYPAGSNISGFPFTPWLALRTILARLTQELHSP